MRSPAEVAVWPLSSKVKCSEAGWPEVFPTVVAAVVLGCSRCTVGISLVFSVGVLFRDVQGVYQFFFLFIGFFNQRFTERDGGYLLSGSLALCSEALDTDKLICVDENRFLWLGSGGYEFYLD